MAATKIRLVSRKIPDRLSIFNKLPKVWFCTIEPPKESPDDDSTKKLDGFAAFHARQEAFLEEKDPKVEEVPQSFPTLLRNSKFVDLGMPEGKVVVGTIFRVVGEDLYIDFGWKFPTVCSKPERNKDFYVIGAKVKLLIKDLEMSTKFLGSERDITLLEADCVLLGSVRENVQTDDDNW